MFDLKFNISKRVSMQIRKFCSNCLESVWLHPSAALTLRLCLCSSSTDSLNCASYLKRFWSVSFRRKYNLVTVLQAECFKPLLNNFTCECVTRVFSLTELQPADVFEHPIPFSKIMDHSFITHCLFGITK